MDKFVSLALSGGVSGAVYSLLAIGLVLNYQTARIFNFGHGATAFSTAYLFFQLNTGLGWPKWVAFVLAACVFAPLAGVLWDRLVFRRLAGASEAATTVASVGILITMPAVVLWVCDTLRTTFDVGFADTSTAYTVPGLGPSIPKTWTITDGFVVNSNQLIVLAVAIVAFLGVWALLRFTSMGLRIAPRWTSPSWPACGAPTRRRRPAWPGCSASSSPVWRVSWRLRSPEPSGCCRTTTRWRCSWRPPPR